MKTTLGLFPINPTVTPEVLDSISVACTKLKPFNLDTSSLNTQEIAIREGISKMYLDAVGNNTQQKSEELFRNNFVLFDPSALEAYAEAEEFYPSVYFDDEDGVMKKLSDAEYPSKVVGIFKEQYYSKIYGQPYKEKEVNILFEEKDNDEWSETDKNAIFVSDVIAKAQDQKETITDFESNIEIEEALDEMRKLQEYFLLNERVDFKELLINYFNIEEKPEEIIQQSRKELEQLIQDNKNIMSDSFSNYLILRQQGRIPREYITTMF